MTRLLAPPAVALMARQRLLQIRDTLRRKRDADRTRFTAIEARVLYLSEQAVGVTNALPSVPIRDFPGAFRSAPQETTSKFFVMGALAPTIPAYSSLFADGQDWLYQTLRKGTRDDRREKVHADTVTFAVEVWRRARALINAADLTDIERSAYLERAKAFFLGHLCHIAGEVVTGPLLSDAAWHLPGPALASPLPGALTGGTDRAASRDVVDALIDDEVKTTVFAPSLIRNDHFASWLPTASEVPPPIFQAFADAVDAIYPDGKRRGLTDFETAFASLPSLPAVSKDWIFEGFSTLRNVMGSGHDWGYWTWVALLTPIALPSLITVPAIAALPRGKDVDDDAQRGDERPWWEVLALQYAGTGLVIPLYIFLFNLASYRGFSQEAWVALIVAAVVLGFSIATLAVIDDPNASAGTRWTLLAIPVVLELFFSFVYIPFIRNGGGRYNRLFASLFVMHIVMSLVALAYLAIPAVVKGLKNGLEMLAWEGVWSVIAFVIGLLIPAAIFYAMGAFGPTPDRSNPFLLAKRHARLFDDGVLVSDGDVAAPTLAELYYPAGDDGAAHRRRRRKLLTLWFQGGTLKAYVRIRGDRTEVKFAALQPPDTDVPDITVPLPRAPVRIGDYAHLLEAVRETGGGAGALKARIDVPESERELLGEGPILGDASEAKLDQTQNDRLAETIRWRELGGDADHGLAVFHATKARLSVAVGARGAASAVDEPDGQVIALQVAAAPTTATRGAAGGTTIVGLNARFLRDLAPGDLIQIGGAANRGIVLAVLDDNNLTTVMQVPGVAALGGGALPVSRVSADRRYDQSGPGVVYTEGGAATAGIPAPAAATITTPPRVVGSGTQFTALFQPGDTIRAAAARGLEERLISRVVSNTVLELDAPFSSDIDQPAGTGSPYVRVGGHGTDGTRVVGSPAADIFSGATAMDQAADLAALLCLGGASHLLTDPERQPTVAGVSRFPGPQPIAQVYQCFRNWNLERRRVNEWKMLITGGAVSEKRGRPAAEPDPMMLGPDEAWAPRSPGEAVANQVGWVPLLRGWLDVARRAGVDPTADTAMRPGDPSNLDLSRGLAFLLDLPDPGVA